MTRFARIGLYWLSGLIFWLPCIVMGAVEGRRYPGGGLGFLVIAILPVFLSLFTLKGLSTVGGEASRIGPIAMWMLLGIWMLGPFCISAATSFQDGGFSRPGTATWLLRNFWMFPATTFMMSAYALTLGGLVIITIWLPLVAIRGVGRTE